MRRRDLGLVPLLSRREAVLGGLAVLAACGAGEEEEGAPAGDSGGEAPVVDPATIDTIVVLMMENRSFDHFLGSLKLLEGRDVDGLTADMSNPDTDGNVFPVAPAQVDCVSDPPHGWSSSHDQFDGGANDGFVKAMVAHHGGTDAAEVMGYYTRAELPVTYALADAYALCDRYFCSVMGPTWPNRFYGHAGTSNGQSGNDLPDTYVFEFPTVWNKLDEAGIPWKYYYTDVPFLGLFANHIREDTAAFLEDFVDDALDGKLPPVVWVDPGFTFNDDHPPHHPGLGQEMIALVVEALAASPQWGRCLLLITYDEHGGFFDHVPPPTTEDDFAADGFDQLGFRVPSIVVSPFAKKGTVSTVFDHTSWIKLVCERHGLTPWTARIAAATSLAEALDADLMATGQGNAPAELPVFDVDDEGLPDQCFDYGGPMAPGRAAPPGQAPPPRGLRKWLLDRYPADIDRAAKADDLTRWIRAKRRELRARA